MPADYDDLIALPGVGDYTAAAVASFAFRRRHVVLDTNVRRVLARTVAGVEFPATAVTRAERDLAAALLPDDGPTAAAWAVATMELGALVCVAAAPRCAACPVADLCAWRAAGYPAYDGPPRKGQAYDGTDRQCRGRLLGVLRDSDGPVHRSRLDDAWPAAEQRERCLRWLVDDGLVAQVSEDVYALPALSAWTERSTAVGGRDGGDGVGEVPHGLLLHRVAGVERQVELEAHKRRVQQADGRAAPAPAGVPGGDQVVGDRRHPHRRWPRGPRTRRARARTARGRRPRRTAAGSASSRGAVTAAQRSSTAARTSGDGGQRADARPTERSLETRSTVATRSSLSREVVEQHPVAGAELGGQRPQAEPDQPVLEHVVGGGLRELVAAAGLPGHRSPLSRVRAHRPSGRGSVASATVTV